MTVTAKVYELVKKIGKGRLAQAELSPEMTLREDLQMDSLDLTELVVLTEDRFNMKINPEEVRNINTLTAMIAFIEAHCAA